MSRTVDMTTGSPTKHILKFALPLIITNIGQQLYLIADAAIVGRGVGVKALAAVGATDWCYWLILWSVTGMTQGFSTYVSRYFGEKNYRRLNKSIAMSTILCVVIGAIFTIGGLLATKPLLTLLKTPSDIFGWSSTYLMTMISGTIIVTAYNMASSVLRAFGDGKTPLVAMIIAALLNIGLDCLFVFVFNWGVFGAAVASVMSQLVSLIFCIVKILKIECVKLDKSVWKPDFRLLKSLVLFGVPLALQFVTVAIGGIILQSSVNDQGSIFIAGYTATNKVYGLLECSAISLGLAACTFLAQNYGARNYARVKKGVLTSTYIVVIMAIVVTGLTLLSRKYMLQLFLDINEPGGAEALDIAVHYLTIMSVYLVILYLVHVFRNALQAMEISVWSMLSGVAECLARVVMAKVVIHWMGSDALFVSEPVAWVGALLLVMVPYLLSYKKLLGGREESPMVDNNY